MNSHRIHYDRRYAMAEEGYPDLVVQGPLQATLLADLAVRRLERPLTTFRFRGLAPAFAGDRSEEHTSELQSLMRISYAVFCLKKKKTTPASYEHDIKTIATEVKYNTHNNP